MIKQVTEAEPVPRTARILVAEDEVISRMDLREMLENLGYLVVGEAGDGVTAVNLTRELRPDLILMDIQLPQMDGYEATRAIRAIPELATVPIIAVTSYTLSGDEAKTRAAGCDGYVAKPFSPRELLAKVREFLPQ